jgi:hypothetical protein
MRYPALPSPTLLFTPELACCPPPLAAKNLYPDIVWTEAACTTASDQNEARMSKGKIADVMI